MVQRGIPITNRTSTFRTSCFGSRADVFQRSRCANAIHRAVIFFKRKKLAAWVRGPLGLGVDACGCVLLIHFDVLPNYLLCLRRRPQIPLFASRTAWVNVSVRGIETEEGGNTYMMSRSVGERTRGLGSTRKIVPEHEVRIPFRDSSWLLRRRQALLTALIQRSCGGEPFKLKEHMERFYRSLVLKYLRIRSRHERCPRR